MTETKTLFDQAKEFITRGVAAQRAIGNIVAPLSHKHDPKTSYEAAEKMVKTGALSRQEERILDAIKCYECYTWKEDFTAKELSNISAINYYTIQHRLSGLHNKGKIICTGAKRDGCMVWRLT